jgi:hypothetical protein
MAAVVRNRFYPQLAIVLALFVFIGFSRTYYLRFLSDLPPLVTLVQLHGLVFTGWLLLFVVQTRLIAADRADLHMRLGIAGVLLAACVVALGYATAFHTAAVPRMRASGLTPSQFSIVALTSITLFALFVSLAVAFRRRAALHKRFMVLAMIAVLGPAIGRLVALFDLSTFNYLLNPGVVAVFVGWCLVQDWRRHRVVHPVYLIGGLVVIASWPLRMMAARSDWWQPIGEWIARVGAGI